MEDNAYSESGKQQVIHMMLKETFAYTAQEWLTRRRPLFQYHGNGRWAFLNGYDARFPTELCDLKIAWVGSGCDPELQPAAKARAKAMEKDPKSFTGIVDVSA